FKDRNKNVMIEGKYLELKFILEARRKEFRFDHSAKEYVFTGEDRLAYALEEGRSVFWEPFLRYDRDCGEFLQESLKEQGLSSLPKSMSLNHKISGSSSNKELVENVRKEIGSCKKVVKLDEISEKILKNIGFASPSSSQIAELSKKLIEENSLNTCRDEKCVCISVDQLTKLSTKSVEEFYKKSSLNSEDQRNLEQGFYVLKQIDIDLAKKNKNLFWERILPDSSERNSTLQARSKAGFTNDISTLRAGKKILIVGKNSVQKVENNQKDSLKKLIELAKICGISLPSDFAKKVSTTILQETHHKSELNELLKNLSWETIKELQSYPLKQTSELKKYIEEVVKLCC
ncbi:MAG: hypothetical protein ACRDD6_04165, partial [Tannerellaceae bacterium]